jgi:uncharacterized protein involved in response to NO
MRARASSGWSLGCWGCWHGAASCWASPPGLAFASIKLGTFGLLLPVYFTVAHRMFPFFAGNVVPGYVPWRPLWLLGAVLALCVAHLGWNCCTPTRGCGWPTCRCWPVAACRCGSWWPRGQVPGLLQVLFLGLAWLPLAISLYAFQSIAYSLTGEFLLGRAPAHALFIGFFGSVLVAMVTRVTQGHSGRPLVMPAVAWFAFVAIQWWPRCASFAEVGSAGCGRADGASGRPPGCRDQGWLLACRAVGGWRIGGIYLSPRTDGKPG